MAKTDEHNLYRDFDELCIDRDHSTLNKSRWKPELDMKEVQKKKDQNKDEKKDSSLLKEDQKDLGSHHYSESSNIHHEDGNDYDPYEDFSDDIRIQELQSIGFIYPNAIIDYPTHTISMHIQLSSEDPITVSLADNGVVRMSLEVTFLPPVSVSFVLPPLYPYEEPPIIHITSEMASDALIEKLLTGTKQIWEDFHDQCIYSMIDFLNEFTQTSLTDFSTTVSDPAKFDRIVQYNAKELQEQFENQTFECEICQADHKGSSCVRFECGHIFCTGCVGSYFANMIDNGDISKVHCPHYECTGEILRKKKYFSKLENWVLLVGDGGDGSEAIEKTMNSLLVPHVSAEILRKVLANEGNGNEKELGGNEKGLHGKEKELGGNEKGLHGKELANGKVLNDVDERVQKYLQLYSKEQYEFIGQILPNRLVECPKVTCNEMVFRRNLAERLCVCTRCKYAFCYDCRKSYHTRFMECKKIELLDQLFHGIPELMLAHYLELDNDSYERKAMRARFGMGVITRALREYDAEVKLREALELYSNMIACPVCLILIEKTEGCNKVTCRNCWAIFCFLCSTVIENSYDHFTLKESPCFEKLFLGMPGVDDAD